MDMNSPPEITDILPSLNWTSYDHISPDQLGPTSLVRIHDSHGERYLFQIMPVGRGYIVGKYEDGIIRNIKLEDTSFCLQPVVPNTTLSAIPMLTQHQSKSVVERVIPPASADTTSSSPRVLFGYPKGGFRKNSPALLLTSNITTHTIEKIIKLEGVNISAESPLEQSLLRFMEAHLTHDVRQRLRKLFAPQGIGPHENIFPGLYNPIYCDSETFDHHVTQLTFLLYSWAESTRLFPLSHEIFEQICTDIQRHVELNTHCVNSTTYFYATTVVIPTMSGELTYDLRFFVDTGINTLADFSLRKKPALH